MKAILLLALVLLASSVYVTSNPKTVYAASCASFSVTPGSGPPATLFTLTARGCYINSAAGEQNPIGRILLDNGDGAYNASDDVQVGDITQLLRSDPDPDYPDNAAGVVARMYTGEFSILLQEGVYFILLESGFDELGQGRVEIILDPNQNPPVNGVCGARISSMMAPPPCDPPNVVNSCCPTICPPVQSGTGWVCTPERAYQCSATNGQVGIDSAIGCIPIEDINDTTAFFVRWALGVGGGIGLFLIAVSGIKIMTTKDDPKRLQDARDTFSAAIAGLVLIVLSVFLMRFLSETLLNIF